MQSVMMTDTVSESEMDIETGKIGIREIHLLCGSLQPSNGAALTDRMHASLALCL
jgi:hypothetical protein